MQRIVGSCAQVSIAGYGALQPELCSDLWCPGGGDSTAGENHAPTSVTTDDGSVSWRRYLVEGIVVAVLVSLLKAQETLGETLDLDLSDRTMTALP